MRKSGTATTTARLMKNGRSVAAHRAGTLVGCLAMTVSELSAGSAIRENKA